MFLKQIDLKQGLKEAISVELLPMNFLFKSLLLILKNCFRYVGETFIFIHAALQPAIYFLSGSKLRRQLLRLFPLLAVHKIPAVASSIPFVFKKLRLLQVATVGLDTQIERRGDKVEVEDTSEAVESAHNEPMREHIPDLVSTPAFT